MFEQSILVKQPTLKPWSVLLSFAVELAGIGLLVILPLVWADKLPSFTPAQVIVSMPRPIHDAPPVQTASHSQAKPSELRPAPNQAVTIPIRIPPKPNLLIDAAAMSDPALAFAGSATGPVNQELADLFAKGERVVPPPRRETVAAAPHVHPVRIFRTSHLDEAQLIWKVVPVYPPLARATRTSGTVRLLAVVGTDGSIRSLQVVSGHPLLVQAALEAVRQWRYKPPYLNGQPVEIVAPIDVTFTLQ